MNNIRQTYVSLRGILQRDIAGLRGIVDKGLENPVITMDIFVAFGKRIEMTMRELKRLAKDLDAAVEMLLAEYELGGLQSLSREELYDFFNRFLSELDFKTEIARDRVIELTGFFRK